MTEHLFYTPQFQTATKIDKGWGFELIFADRPTFCGKILHYNKAGVSSSQHFHIKKAEVFYVRGKFQLDYFDEQGFPQTRELNFGDVVRLDPGVPHKLTPLQDHVEIFEVSTHDDPMDVMRIAPGASQYATSP